MYDRILVPTDGSPSMESVIDHASHLAGVHEADLHGIYVVDTGSYATLPIDTSWDGMTEMLREEGKQAVSELASMAGETPVETTVREGNPSTEIVDYAREQNCDCIVMGTHGRAGIDRLLLGSVAERVVRSSPIPVLTMPVSRAEESQNAQEAAETPNL